MSDKYPTTLLEKLKDLLRDRYTSVRIKDYAGEFWDITRIEEQHPDMLAKDHILVLPELGTRDEAKSDSSGTIPRDNHDILLYCCVSDPGSEVDAFRSSYQLAFDVRKAVVGKELKPDNPQEWSEGIVEWNFTDKTFVAPFLSVHECQVSIDVSYNLDETP